MNTLLPSCQLLLEEAFTDYSEVSKQVIKQIGNHRYLSEFDCFNTRFKLNIHMEVSYGDGLSKISREDTLRCYQLMLKLSDLWFSFEHLIKVMDSHGIYKSNPQKYRPYDEAFYHSCGLRATTETVNESLYTELLAHPRNRQQLYLLVDYLAKRTKGGTKSCIQEVDARVRSRAPLLEEHFYSLCYGIRNVYVHEGVAAALRSKDYKFKVHLYSHLYDHLTISTVLLAKGYCREQLAKLKAIPPLAPNQSG